MEKILEVKDLHVSFRTGAGIVKAVRGVSFDLNKGETLAIVGESGSGKSVTSKAIMRLIDEQVGKIERGEILYENTNLLTLSSREMRHMRGANIAMVFQDPMTSLNPTMTVGKQIAESLRIHQNCGRKEAKERAIELMRLVEITQPEVRYKQYPHQFSGGMRQRIVIAIALACNPRVLIADEPTTALDVTVQAAILELLGRIQEKTGTSIIFITHDFGVVANVADRVIVMYAGKVVEAGTVDEVFYHPQHPYTWGLLDSMPTMTEEKEELYAIPGSPPDLAHLTTGDPFAPRNEYAMQIDWMEEPPLFPVPGSDTHFAATWLLHPQSPMLTREVRGAEKKSSQAKEQMASKQKLVEVKQVHKYFRLSQGKVLHALNDISLEIYKGETFGLVGESGSGKSTLGRTIIGLYDADEGQIIYDEKDVQRSKSSEEKREHKRKMQMIFQDPYSSLNPRLTVGDIIGEGIDIHQLAAGPEERQAMIHELLETVGLNSKHANRFPHEFSGGQRQRIGIARALAVKPEFIIADEPISALDVSIQAQVVNLMKRLQKEKGLTYLFIAHDLSMVKYISDRIAVMYQGRIVELASSKDLYANPMHAYTRSLISAIPEPDPKSERTRKRIEFDKEAYAKDMDRRLFREVAKDHWVLCTDEEYQAL